MKILQITPEAPGYFSGGKLGVKQTALSLVQNGHTVDYVGPEIEDPNLCSLYKKVYFLKPGYNIPLRIYDTLHMNTNQRYRSWVRLKLDYSSYDAIVMDFTKLNYVLDRIPVDRLIVRVHNVEADYSLHNFQHNKNIINFIDKNFAGKREAVIVSNARKLLVLTEKDKIRLHELYGIAQEKMEILPVCVQEQEKRSKNTENTKTVKMIITGSLWFGPNYEGIKWFINNVYTKLNFPKELIVAGSNPNDELVNILKKLAEVTLVDSPKSMKPYFEKADIAIAPVFTGAGMKVKVAEALSFGLPVVGTTHAFEGYQITQGVNSYHANDTESFIDCVNQYYNLEAEGRLHMRQNSYDLFQQHYSQPSSNKIFQRILSELN